MKTIVARIRRGGGKTLNYLSAVIFAFALCAALTASAADWTDANNVTYTALKSVNANGSARITLTGITPAGTEIVKFKYKPATVTANACLFCARNSSAGNQFAGFFIYTKSGTLFRFRADRNTTQSYCTTTTKISADDHTIVVNFGGTNQGVITIDGTVQTLSPAMNTDSYTVGSELALFQSHKALSSSSWDNKAKGDLYYFQLWNADGTTLEHNFMPAVRDSDSVVGLYDTAARTFWPATAGTFTSVAYGASDRSGVKWTGAGDGVSMSDGSNWEGGVAPGDGDDLDFTIAVPNAAINANISATFGKIYLGAGDLPAFTGSLTATSASDLARIQDYADETASFTFSIAAGNYTWNGTGSNWGDANAWDYDNAAATWVDNNNAIFNTADATATLTADATANSLTFNQNATVGGTATLTVPTVSVAADVAATIFAPTAGALEKTGAGTLTLGSSRTDATTLSEGTLELSGTASLDWTKFTLGTDAAKPVTLEFGTTAAFSSVPSTWKIGNEANITSTIIKNGGDWTTPTHIVIGNANGASTTFINESGNFTSSGNFRVGDSGSATLVVNGGTAGSTSSSSTQVFVGYTGEGTLVVTNSGVVSAKQSLYVARSANGTISVSDGGRIEVGGEIIFHLNNTDGRGVINLGSGGLIVSGSIYDYISGGSTTFNFDGGTLKRRAAGNFFAANNDAAAIDVTVSANGGTLDNNTFAVALPCTITGAGGMTLSGSGTTTISANQSYLGTTTVSNETTLSVSGGVTFAGSVVFEAGAALDIAGYDGTTPLAATAITFPEYGTVPLTLNGGVFAEGVYTICSATGVTAADGGKFSFSTENDLASSWSVEDGTLVLTVGIVDPNAWTGRGGDGRMSTAANWGGGEVPAAGSDIDLSGISADTTIIADANRTFGAVTMGDGVITFTNSFAATSFSDTSKVAVAADSTVTVVGDLVFATNVTACVCYSIAEGGTFAVTGDIIATAEHTGYVVPCIGQDYIPGTISAKGIVNNAYNQDYFYIVRAKSNTLANWLVGEDGISGTSRFSIRRSNYRNSYANIRAQADFTVSADIRQEFNLTLDTAGYTITLGTNTTTKSGGILGGAAGGMTTVTGAGRVVVNYNVNDLSSLASSRTNVFSVATGATLTLNPGANIGFGALTIQDEGTLEIQSGTTTFGNLTVEENAILSFNFTDRRNAPVLALYDGAEVTAQDPFTVKVSGTVWPSGGEKLLTTCGGFDGIYLTLSAVGEAARWANQDRLSVNADCNIVLDVKPMGTVILLR